MRKLEISLGLIKQGNSYLLQFRDGNPSTGAVNMIGCFGGKIEPGEDAPTAICRELREETSLDLSNEDIEYLGEVEVISDYQLEEIKVHAEIFLVAVGDILVQAKEGRIVEVVKGDILNHLNKMTPGTRAVFEKFVL